MIDYLRKMSYFRKIFLLIELEEQIYRYIYTV